MSFKRQMRKRTRADYTERNTSESEYEEIIAIHQLPRRTSSWNKTTCDSLNIRYVNSDSIHTMIDVKEEDDPIFLPDWNESRFLTDTPSINNNKISTIIHKLKRILIEKRSFTLKEVVVDAFVMSLLQYLGFDDYPYSLYPQLQFSTPTMDGIQISSKVEFMVTKMDRYVVLILEDKTPQGISELTNWGEHQIAGEIFVTAFHEISMRTSSQEPIEYPLKIYAIRIVGTYFTFYRCDVSREYMSECMTRLPKASLVIQRYPPQEKSSEHISRSLSAWNFCDPQDRQRIVQTLKSLRL